MMDAVMSKNAEYTAEQLPWKVRFVGRRPDCSYADVHHGDS